MCMYICTYVCTCVYLYANEYVGVYVQGVYCVHVRAYMHAYKVRDADADGCRSMM